MADSENSRTLSAITCRKIVTQDAITENLPYTIDRRNLLSVAARLLTARVADPGDRRTSGPTPVNEMWPRWYACHLQRLKATRLKQKLEMEMLQRAGGFPVVKLQAIEDDGSVEVRSFADINRMASKLDAEHLSQVRAELRMRRRRWKEADKLLGYGAAIAREHELAVEAGISGRVMEITTPRSLVEVAAKLHCLIIMHDPGLKFEDTPWPELRRLLRDVVRLVATSSPETREARG